MKQIFFSLSLLSLTFSLSRVQGQSRKSDSFPLTVLSKGRTYDNQLGYDYKISKQDYFTSPTAPDLPPKSLTSHVIHTTIRVLGVIATFTAFILIPVIELIVSAVLGSPILFSKRRQFDGGRGVKTNSWELSEEARGILDSSRCLERMVCYVNKATTARSFVEGFVFGQKSMTGKQFDPDLCGQYTCYPFSFIVRLFIYLIDWNTLLKV